MKNSKTSRRVFLKLGAFTAISPLLPRLAMAGALSETDPTAVALGYRADATTVNDSAFKPGSTCANCMQFKAGSGTVGSCALFPGKDVAAAGWCRAWVKKP